MGGLLAVDGLYVCSCQTQTRNGRFDRIDRPTGLVPQLTVPPYLFPFVSKVLQVYT